MTIHTWKYLYKGWDISVSMGGVDKDLLKIVFQENFTIAIKYSEIYTLDIMVRKPNLLLF